MKKLSPREKKALIGAIAAIIVFILFQFGVSPLLDRYEQMEGQIPKLKADLRAARRLQKNYKKLEAAVQAIRSRVDEREGAFNPYDFLDKLARKEGVRSNLDKIKSSTEEVSDQYNEETVDIRLKNVNLAKLVRYLYSIEHSGQLLTVKELVIEPDKRHSERLDVKFNVSTFAKAKD
jgi:type II secretory pathway component PulM